MVTLEIIVVLLVVGFVGLAALMVMHRKSIVGAITKASGQIDTGAAIVKDVTGK